MRTRFYFKTYICRRFSVIQLAIVKMWVVWQIRYQEYNWGLVLFSKAGAHSFGFSFCGEDEEIYKIWKILQIRPGILQIG